MAAPLGALRADEVHAPVQGLSRVRGLADHVHDQDAALVQPVHHPLRGDADGADEQLGLLLDDHFDELVQLSFGVVVVGLSRARADLREREVDAEWQGRRGEEGFELVDHGAELLGAIAETAYRTEATSGGDGSSEGSGRGMRHAG